jgi:hypothetical protein
MSQNRHVDRQHVRRRRVAASAAVLTAALGPALAFSLSPTAASAAPGSGRSGTVVAPRAAEPPSEPGSVDPPKPATGPTRAEAPDRGSDAARRAPDTVAPPVTATGRRATAEPAERGPRERRTGAPATQEPTDAPDTPPPSSPNSADGAGPGASGSTGNGSNTGSGTGTRYNPRAYIPPGEPPTQPPADPPVDPIGDPASNQLQGAPLPSDPAQPGEDPRYRAGIAGPDRAPANGSPPRADIGSAQAPDLAAARSDDEGGLIPASWAAHLPDREVGIQIFIAGLIALIISITGLVTVALRRRP